LRTSQTVKRSNAVLESIRHDGFAAAQIQLQAFKRPSVNRAKEWADGLPPQSSGIYLALSDDLLKWSSQVKLVSGYAQRVLGRAVALAPTILFDPDDKPSGWLIYAYSPKLTTPKLANLGTPTYMVGRKIIFAKKP
jgi:hypothetical protein